LPPSLIICAPTREAIRLSLETIACGANVARAPAGYRHVAGKTAGNLGGIAGSSPTSCDDGTAATISERPAIAAAAQPDFVTAPRDIMT
jgi:hypothetical protein